MRALKRAVLCVAAVLLLGYLGVVALRPFLLDREARAEVRRLKAAVAAAEAANEALRQRIPLLKTEKGIEVEARRHGWVRPGEVLIQTSEPPPPPSPPPAKAGKPQPTPALGAVGSGEGLLHRFLDWLAEVLGCRHRPAPVPAR